jgi:rubrerythrin
MKVLTAILRAPYVCRGCGTEVSYPARFKKCPVCGIKWG